MTREMLRGPRARCVPVRTLLLGLLAAAFAVGVSGAPAVSEATATPRFSG